MTMNLLMFALYKCLDVEIGWKLWNNKLFEPCNRLYWCKIFLWTRGDDRNNVYEGWDVFSLWYYKIWLVHKLVFLSTFFFVSRNWHVYIGCDVERLTNIINLQTHLFWTGNTSNGFMKETPCHYFRTSRFVALNIFRAMIFE